MAPQRDTYSSRIDKLFYSRTDEKELLKGMLYELFEGKHFHKALDIGPGPGHISVPLFEKTSKMTFVEIDTSYEQTLKEKFPRAKIITESINQTELETDYNIILLSHNLYYHPTDQWIPLCQRLKEALAPRGSLILVMNEDQGDWWWIIDQFWDRLRPHICFDYIRLSKFKRSLKKLGSWEEKSYSYNLKFETISELKDFIGKQALQIYDENILNSEDDNFKKCAEELFRRNNSPEVKMKSTLLVHQFER